MKQKLLHYLMVHYVLHKMVLSSGAVESSEIWRTLNTHKMWRPGVKHFAVNYRLHILIKTALLEWRNWNLLVWSETVQMNYTKPKQLKPKTGHSKYSHYSIWSCCSLPTERENLFYSILKVVVLIIQFVKWLVFSSFTVFLHFKTDLLENHFL